MSYLTLTKAFQLCIHFYKKFCLLSIIMTLLLLFLNRTIPIIAILIFKLIFFGVIFLVYLEPAQKKSLLYYKNFGLSKMVLIAVSFLIDVTITTVLILIMNSF